MPQPIGSRPSRATRRDAYVRNLLRDAIEDKFRWKSHCYGLFTARRADLRSYSKQDYIWLRALCNAVCHAERLASRRRLTLKLERLCQQQSFVGFPHCQLPAGGHRNNVTTQDRSGCALDLDNCVSSEALDLLRLGPGFVPSAGKANQRVMQDVEVGVERMAYSLRWWRQSSEQQPSMADGGPAKFEPKIWHLKAHGFQ